MLEDQLLPGEKVVERTRIHWGIYLPGILFAPILIGFAFLFVAWLRRISTEIAVTDRRLLVRTGILTRTLDELRLEKLESLQAQTFVGFGWGTLRYVGSGGTSRTIPYVATPLAFRNTVLRLADAARPQEEALRAG